MKFFKKNLNLKIIKIFHFLYKKYHNLIKILILIIINKIINKKIL